MNSHEASSSSNAGETSGSKSKWISDFFGVYLLISLNPRMKGRTYIGFTVDPTRRIQQHNGGSAKGGAKRTSDRGPWEMVLIVHGFPNSISALRFEWAWQHPKRSRRLNKLPSKRSREKLFDYNIRILSEMLGTSPWSRLPLVLRWLRPDIRQAPLERAPPSHVQVTEGSLEELNALRRVQGKEEQDEHEVICSICLESVNYQEKIVCLSIKCRAVSHLLCLAQNFLKNSDEMLPIEGHCPVCNAQQLWGDLVQSLKVSRATKGKQEEDPGANLRRSSSHNYPM